MKCPFRIHSIEYDSFMSGEKHHHEEFEECDENECPFYVKTLMNKEYCKRVIMVEIDKCMYKWDLGGDTNAENNTI